MDISCAFPDCTNPVIGRCIGFGRECRQYYCAAPGHGDGTLCYECSVMWGYVEDAERVYRLAERTRRRLLLLPRLGSIMLLMATVIALFIDLEMSIILFFAALAGSVMATIVRNWHETPPVKRLIREITMERPRFDEFYAEYRKIR